MSWTNFSGVNRPFERGGFSAVVLVHIQVRLLHSHLHKWTPLGEKQTRVQFKQTKHRRCKNTLRQTYSLVQLVPVWMKETAFGPEVLSGVLEIISGFCCLYYKSTNTSVCRCLLSPTGTDACLCETDFTVKNTETLGLIPMRQTYVYLFICFVHTGL